MAPTRALLLVLMLLFPLLPLLVQLSHQDQ